MAAFVADTQRTFNGFSTIILRPLALFLLFTGLFGGGHKPPTVIFRINMETTGPGQSPAQALPLVLPNTGETILVRTIPEITERNLRAVDIHPDGTCQVTFDHQGRINLDVSTAANQGRRLVVSVDGVLIYYPIIDEEITTGTLVIPHPIPAPVLAAMKQLADQNTLDHKDSVIH